VLFFPGFSTAFDKYFYTFEARNISIVSLWVGFIGEGKLGFKRRQD
jgi:hypothetical protein